MDEPNAVNGIIIPIAITENVVMITGNEARLWMNGILRVRIICTISVCDNKPSINHPDWNRDWSSGIVHLKIYHITKNVAISNIELIGPMRIIKRLRSEASHLRVYLFLLDIIIYHR